MLQFWDTNNTTLTGGGFDLKITFVTSAYKCPDSTSKIDSIKCILLLAAQIC